MKKTTLLIVVISALIFADNIVGSAIEAYALSKAKDSTKIKKIETKLIKKLQVNRGDILTGYLLCGIWIMNERYDACHTLLDSILKYSTSTSDSIEIFRNKAYIFHSEQKYKNAIRYFDTLSLQEETAYYGLHYKAHCFFATNQIMKASHILKEGYNDDDASTISYIAWNWAMLGNIEKAEQYYKEALRKASLGEDLKTVYAEHLMLQSRYDEAYTYLKDYQNDFTSTHVKTYALFTEYYLGKGNIPEAEQMLQRVKRIFPHFPGTYYLQAQLHIEKKEYRKAEEILENYVQKYPAFTEFLYALAKTQVLLGDNEKCLNTLQKMSESGYIGLADLMKEKAFDPLKADIKFTNLSKEISQREENYRKALLSVGL